MQGRGRRMGCHACGVLVLRNHKLFPDQCASGGPKRLRSFLFYGNGQRDVKTFVVRAFDRHSAAVVIDDMFHDRKAQPASARVAGAMRVDAVKTLCQAGNVMRIDPGTIVADLNQDAVFRVV